ncbi:MAG: SPOR domain-containing protein [Devosia sp.]|uniref:SPOR domain-containing protein n=1 Tax=Devosia sp. TaxID=1871048 RepID=UPI0024C5280E|nr:SPOR domain-containing protein [Devosia sp.]UYO00069.1 MAG: SPOR domain-containing protein [Devosia sp.]
MAAHLDDTDDLIAELAKLMADDARPEGSESKANPEPQKPVIRIPGGDERPPEPVAPAAAAPLPSVRIPGQDAPAPAPAKALNAEPFRFDFDLNLNRKPAGPATELPPAAAAPQPAAAAPQPAAAAPIVEPFIPASRPAQPSPLPQATTPAVPVQAEPAAEANADLPDLDQDSLADLIAAELAQDMAPETEAVQAQPEPEAFEPEPAPQDFAPLESEPQEPVEEIPQVDGPARGEDNFVVAPVFGLGDRQAEPVATQPDPEAAVASAEAVSNDKAPKESDALGDIKRLVGSALFAGVARRAKAAERNSAAPAEPVMDEPVAPARREPAADAGGNFDSVDEAILAAAAATGAHVEWVDGSEAGADDAMPAEDRQRRFVPSMPQFNRAVVGPLVAVGLLAVAGLGLYWVLGQGGGPEGPAPLISADATAVKEVPEVTETAETQSVVFNEISGANNPADEQIVSRDQSDEQTVSEIAATTTGAGTGGTTGAAASGLIDTNAEGLVNRKVRTVTVRPDGTIVSGDEGVAGTTMLPVDRPDVPEVPGADFSTPDLIASAGQAEVEPTPAVAPAPATPVVEAGSVVPVADAAGNPLAGRSVTIPRERPGNFQQIATSALANASAAPAVTTPDPAAALPAAAPAATATAPGAAAAYVQLASQRSEEAARSTAQQIVSRFGPLFGGANLEITRVDLGERGIYYRVLAPADSRAAASNLCTNLKAAGGDCVVL